MRETSAVAAVACNKQDLQVLWQWLQTVAAAEKEELEKGALPRLAGVQGAEGELQCV